MKVAPSRARTRFEKSFRSRSKNKTIFWLEKNSGELDAATPPPPIIVFFVGGMRAENSRNLWWMLIIFTERNSLKFGFRMIPFR